MPCAHYEWSALVSIDINKNPEMLDILHLVRVRGVVVILD